MSLNALKERWIPASGGLTAPYSVPRVVFEIEPGFVAGARLEGGGGQPRLLGRMGVRELKPHTVEPLPHRSNIRNEAALGEAYRDVAAVVGNGAGRLGLVIPDGTVRVGILDFETLPESRSEVEALASWRMKENLPWPPEETRVSYQITRRESGGVELLVLAARKSVLAEYEKALAPINGGPVLILPATIALLPLLPEGDGTGELVIHVCSGWVTTAVVERDRARLWRTRQTVKTGAEDLGKEIASEAARALASASDNRKVEIGRVWLCARPPATQELGAALAGALSREVRPLAPAAGLDLSLPVAEQSLFERYGAAFAGIASNPV